MPLQRNATDHALDVPAASVTVEPGGTLDWPEPVIGFEPVKAPSPARPRTKRSTEEDSTR